MKTTDEIVNIIYSIVNTSPLKGVITGNVYKLNRPVSSTFEDVVINSVASDAEIIQRGAFNVNIHVPAIAITINGIQQKQPNTARMLLLSSIAKSILLQGWGDHYNYWIENQGTYQDDITKDWYSNFRLIFKVHNTI